MSETFHGHLRESLVQHQLFVAKMRVETAKRLLTDSEKFIETIAAECGFGSMDSMQRAFRKETGRAPGAFRSRSNPH